MLEAKKDPSNNRDESVLVEAKAMKGNEKTQKLRKHSELEYIGDKLCQVQRADQTWRKFNLRFQPLFNI